MKKIELLPLRTIPEVKPGDDLGEIITMAAGREVGTIEDKDIAVVTMKIVSKAENCLMRLHKVRLSEKARRIAGKTGKPVQLVQAILDHSEKIVGVIPFYDLIRDGLVDTGSLSRRPELAAELIRRDPSFLITRDKHGEVYSDAGVDTSNHPEGVASYPPPDPDLSAAHIRQSIKEHTGKDIGVIIADTELFLLGTVDMPRGISGIPIRSRRFGEKDLFNRPKYGGIDLIAFELTAAASLLFGQTDEGVPAVIVRGCDYEMTDRIIEQGLDFSSMKKVFKKILVASIKFRISEHSDTLLHRFRKN
jgi:coenzyme F420-0:L-glutamate ligase/coenzyme F420-1:gamma-L-glutamate ligase